MNSKDTNQKLEDIKFEEKKLKELEIFQNYEGEDEIITSQKAWDDLEEERRKPVVKFLSRIPKLDEMVDGFREGDLVVISAPTKMGKCFAKGTKILMYNGSVKKIEDIKIGDKIMGSDSNPRNVLQLGRGKEKMYKIILRNKDNFICNESHILSLRETGINKKRKGNIINISVRDYLNKNKNFKHTYKIYKSGVNFKAQKLSIAPYFLGLWLGDGNSGNIGITTADEKIKNYIYFYADKLKLGVNIINQKNNKSKIYSITRKNKKGGSQAFSLQSELRLLDLINNKYIPSVYKINSRKNRLELLAGLIDSDGYKNEPSGIIISNKNKKLVNDISFLVKSLGLSVSVNKKLNKKYNKNYYYLNITGNLSRIPLLLKRKFPRIIKNIKEPLNYSFKIEELKENNYYGIVIDKDNLFLLADFTVVHNTTLAQTFTHSFARDEISCLWFSYELTKLEFLKKFGESLPFFTLPKQLTGNSLDWLEQRIMESITKYGTKVVFIDHLHFLIDMSFIGQRGNVSLLIGSIMRRLKQIALKWNICIVLIAHTTKIAFDKEPDLADIRDCLPSGQLVYNDGRYIPVEMLEKGDKVISFGQKFTLQDDVITDIWDTGKKKIYKLTTKTGREIKCSDGQKFLATTFSEEKGKFAPNQKKGIKGWTRLKDLKIGQKIAVVMKYPERKYKQTISENRALLLGWLIGDGHITKNGNSEIIAETIKEAEFIIKIAFEEFGLKCKIVKYKDKNAFRVYLTNGEKNKPNLLAQWLRKEKILDSGIDKNVPKLIFSQPDCVIAKFLSGLFQADGSVYSHKGQYGEERTINYSSISENLIKSVQSLLLRFGVISTLRKQSLKSSGFRTKNSFIYSLTIRGRDIIRYGKQIGFYLHKQEKYEEIVKNYQANVRRKLRDIYFDKVKSIEYIGEEETWDISVKGHHTSLKNNSYCVNDILTHNSSFISQEADTVLMIWRLVEKETKEFGNRAKLAVLANRRNGSVGKMTLRLEDNKFLEETEIYGKDNL